MAAHRRRNAGHPRLPRHTVASATPQRHALTETRSKLMQQQAVAQTHGNGRHPGTAEYGSDVVVELLRELGIPYIALNPGASYRGLHDSLVNFGARQLPEI